MKKKKYPSDSPEIRKIYIAKYRSKQETKIKELEYNRRRSALWRDNKKRLKEEFGGKCIECGFDKDLRALHFHHLYDKKYTISNMVHASYAKMKKEASKCVLLCPNCHALKHLTEIDNSNAL